jgi:hypothetical protein
LKIVWEDLLGFVPTFAGLQIHPHLPKVLRAAPLTATRQTRAGSIIVDLSQPTRRTYDLEIKAGDIIPWSKLRPGLTVRVR